MFRSLRCKSTIYAIFRWFRGSFLSFMHYSMYILSVYGMYILLYYFTFIDLKQIIAAPNISLSTCTICTTEKQRPFI